MKEKKTAALLAKVLQDLAGPQQKGSESSGKKPGKQVMKKIQMTDARANGKQNQVQSLKGSQRGSQIENLEKSVSLRTRSAN